MQDKKQAQMKEQISMYMKKKDYYDILGVDKTCTQEQVKKAYKKLALRFHPDKNKVQGAKQVFKKVSNAYTTLNNQQKREHYDKYGPEQAQPARTRTYQYRQGHDQQFDQFDDLFRAFFGGSNVRFNHQNGFQRGGFSFHMGGQRAQARAHQPQQGFNFSYLFLILIAIYLVAPYFRSKPYFSMNASSEYRFKVSSDLLHVPYFVRQDFFTASNGNPSLKKSIDETVDFQFLTKLNQQCDHSIKLRKNYQYQAYQYSPGAYRESLLTKAKQVDQAACRRMQEIRQNYPDYIRDLFYYY